MRGLAAAGLAGTDDLRDSFGDDDPGRHLSGGGVEIRPGEELGVEAIELMPVADFAGDRNWGYDGVALYAPARCYGRPDDLRVLVDGAHLRGLAVILDVVYNHLGPQGNILHRYCADYFRKDRETPWGSAFNLDGKRHGPVREFLLGNVAYWLDEFRFDGLRLDATHAIPDSSPHHLLEEIAVVAHARGAFVIVEDDRNNSQILRQRDGTGFGIDAAWADDFHHQIRVAVTGTRQSYFAAYQGTPREIAETLEAGWTYRGQPFAPWQGRPRGSPSEHLPARAFVDCIENHDQIGNRALGERLEHLTSPALFRAASMLLCLGPYPVLVFMGQEWAASTPFLYFCNHGGDLGRQITEGRRRELADTRAAGDTRAIPDPEALSSFADSKLLWEERDRDLHAATLELYRECLRQRRELSSAGALEREHWSVHVSESFVAIRYRLPRGDRLLLVTFQEGHLVESALAGPLWPGPDATWRLILASESRRFGGPKEEAKGAGWRLDGPGALWLEAERRVQSDVTKE